MEIYIPSYDALNPLLYGCEELLNSIHSLLSVEIIGSGMSLPQYLPASREHTNIISTHLLHVYW